MLETRWDFDEGSLLLRDAMLWPESRRPPEQANVHAIVRTLRCVRGKVRCELELKPGRKFEDSSPNITAFESGFTLTLPDVSLRFWSSHSLEIQDGRLHGLLELKEGEEFWSVLDSGATGQSWSEASARDAIEKTSRYWQDWTNGLRRTSAAPEIRRTAVTVHLLTYAPDGAVVAAPTTSLPERIGAGWNADYRLCWVRDASLSVGMLARLCNLEETEQYLQWMTKRLSRFGKPLQVLYDVHGHKRPSQHKLSDVAGYRGSKPVRLGNHAYKQHQLGAYGYLCDCAWIYLSEGGRWREEYWNLIRRLANYTVKNWQRKENGIWELPEQLHYVNSKVLSWVTLDRAIRIAQRVNTSFDAADWASARDAIHAEVLDKGWSERLNAFRQHYDGDNLDAAALLMPVMDFLPADDPHVLATIDRITEFLTIDDFVFRFDPLQVPGMGQEPLGQYEGAFLPCTFWLATACAKAGQIERAEKTLASVERIVGPVGLFAEAVDPRTKSFLGNTPLLFSHVEYARAKLEIARQRGG